MNMQVIPKGNEKQIGKLHRFCDSGKFPNNKQNYCLTSGWQSEVELSIRVQTSQCGASAPGNH